MYITRSDVGEKKEICHKIFFSFLLFSFIFRCPRSAAIASACADNNDDENNTLWIEKDIIAVLLLIFVGNRSVTYYFLKLMKLNEYDEELIQILNIAFCICNWGAVQYWHSQGQREQFAISM